MMHLMVIWRMCIVTPARQKHNISAWHTHHTVWKVSHNYKMEKNKIQKPSSNMHLLHIVYACD